IARHGHAQQAEGQATEPCVLGSPVVTLANRGEELVRGEWETANAVNLIEKNHHWMLPLNQHDFPYRRKPALHRAQTDIGIPELFEFVFQFELVAHAGQ